MIKKRRSAKRVGVVIGSIMKVVEWFVKYIGIQGLLAIGFFVVFCIMTIRGDKVNPEFWGILGIIIGFYFAKNGRVIAEEVKNKNKRK